MPIDFQSLASRLLSSAESHVSAWLPLGKKRGHEWVVGSLRGEEGTSLSINLNTGKWADFASDQKGGDLISLYAAIHGIKQSEAAKQLGAGDDVPMQPVNRVEEPEPEFTPPPEGRTHDCDHFKLGKPVKVWQYKSEAGKLLGYVARYEPEGERKQIVPWTWVGGKWAMKQFPKPRPLYNLDTLAAKPDAPVLLVEGEKAADAATGMTKGIYTVTTWAGGSQAWQKADWSVLKDRKVLIWPDRDDAGYRCALAIADHLLKKCEEVKVIQYRPEELGDGWDAADAIGEGMDWAKFKEWAKPRAQLAVVPVKPPPPAEHEGDTRTKDEVMLEPKAVDYYTLLPNCNDKGKPQATIENLREVCNRLGVVVRYNVIKKEEEILLPGQGFSVDNRANASLAWLMSECAKFGMPISQSDGAVTYLADQNPHNPVASWIISKPWDGKNRLSDLCATVHAANEHRDKKIMEMKNTLIKRWMLSAIAAVFCPTGVSAHGVLTFQGEQYVGKTKWFLNLVPKNLNVVQDGMILRPDDRDSVKQACSFWLVELGELDATFRKSDIAQLKSFLTRDRDVLRRAYAKRESEFARRTVFFGSVNPKEFLHDPTGNRRYWTIEVDRLDIEHGIDMQQCWAQVYELYKKGEGWYLLPEEMKCLNDHNKGFEVRDPIEERIRDNFAWDSDSKFWRWISATQALRECGLDKPTSSEATKAGHVIRSLNGNNHKRCAEGRMVLVPILSRQV